MTLHTDSTTTRHHLRSPLERRIYGERKIQQEVGKCTRNGGRRIIENPKTDKYLRVRQMGGLNPVIQKEETRGTASATDTEGE